MYKFISNVVSTVSYAAPVPEPPMIFAMDDVSVSVAESVTAGALANSLCSKPGASHYFKGGVVAYSTTSKKDILNIDTAYAEAHNHANPFTTAEMARSIVKMFKSRIGIATTGYSLPTYREENKARGECALAVHIPYVCIALYDALLDREIVVTVEYDIRQPNEQLMRAEIQAKAALKATSMYNEYVAKILHL